MLIGVPKEVKTHEFRVGLTATSVEELVRADVVQSMRQGAVIVDVAIDQGGCFESSHPTTHTDPTYVVDGVVHYCVTNMPSAVARTASHALNNVTLPHVLALANRGYRRALQDNPHLQAGLNVQRWLHYASGRGRGPKHALRAA